MQVRVEHLDHPLGIGEREPRLSWRLPAGAGRQVAYEVALDDGTSSRVEGDAQRAGAVAGQGRWPRANGARSGCASETDRGQGEWSEPPRRGRAARARRTGGRVDLARRAEAGPAGHRPAYRLRGEVVVDRARGPGPAVRHRARDLRAERRRAAGRDRRARRPATPSTRTAPRCRPTTSPRCSTPGRARARGAARRRVVPRPGRHAARRRPVGHRDGVPGPAAPRARGRHAPPSSAPTRPGAGRASHILAADLIEGQREDRRLRRPAGTPGRRRPGASVSDRGYDALVCSPAPPVRAVEELRPVVGDRACGRACTSSTSARTSTAGSGSATSVLRAPRSR